MGREDHFRKTAARLVQKAQLVRHHLFQSRSFFLSFPRYRRPSQHLRAQLLHSGKRSGHLPVRSQRAETDENGVASRLKMKTHDVPDTAGNHISLLLELLRQFLLVVVLEGRVGDDDERNAQPESTQDTSGSCMASASDCPNWVIYVCMHSAIV